MKKLKVLQSIRPFDLENGRAIGRFAGNMLPGKIADKPRARLPPRAQRKILLPRPKPLLPPKLLIDNWRWAGVFRFYLRTGKRLAKRTTEIVIQFRRAPHIVFRRRRKLSPTGLILNIQPDEGISVTFPAQKRPVNRNEASANVTHEFLLSRSFWRGHAVSAYAHTLNDCVRGGCHALRIAGDSVEAAWSLVDPIIDVWKCRQRAPPCHNMQAGSWGPKEIRPSART